MPKLYVVRHGETNWNRTGCWQGQVDTQLNQLGEEQARKTGEWFAQERVKVDQMYSSDLTRAFDTAKFIRNRAFQNQKITKDRRLREKALGCFEGRKLKEIKKLYPEYYSAWRSGNPNYKIPAGENTRGEKGESTNEHLERTKDFLRDIALRHDRDHTVLIICHGGVLEVMLRVFLSQLTGKHELLSHPRKNCSISVINMECESSTEIQYRIVKWAVSTHVEGLEIVSPLFKANGVKEEEDEDGSIIF